MTLADRIELPRPLTFSPPGSMYELGKNGRTFQPLGNARAHAALRGEDRPSGEGVNTRLLFPLATGAGKTVMQGHMALDFFEMGWRTLMICPAHLVHQQANRFREIADDRGVKVTVGEVKGKDNDTKADIVIASDRTLARPERRRQLYGFGALLADEVHHIRARTWMETIDYLGAFGHTEPRPLGKGFTADENLPGCGCGLPPSAGLNAHPGIPLLGYSATPFRTDGLDLGYIFQEQPIKKSIWDGIREGWLADVVPFAGNIQDVDLGSARGDYSDDRVADALLKVHAPERMAEILAKHAAYPDGTRRPTIQFMPRIDTADTVATMLRGMGITAEVWDQHTPAADRIRFTREYNAGQLSTLVNVMCLSEGFDAPSTACIGFGRPTKSKGLLLQQLGRGTRLFTGKANCLLIDMVKATEDNQLVTINDLLPSDVDVADGDSILAAMAAAAAKPKEEKEDSGTEAEGPMIAEQIPEQHGEIVLTKLNIFDKVPSDISTTYGGIQFVSTGEGAVYLWPRKDGDGYTVSFLPSGSQDRRRDSVVLTTSSGRKLTKLVFEDAVDWMVRKAAEMDSLASKTASWKKRPPTQKVLAQLANLTPVPVRGKDYVTCGDAVALLQVVWLSPVLDADLKMR